MIGFGLVTEGITDQIVIRQILHSFFNDRDIPIEPLSPRIDETDRSRMVEATNWHTVLEYCQSETFREFLEYREEFVVIQIDTDVLKSENVSKKHLLPSLQADTHETVLNVQNRLIELIGQSFYETHQDRIIFAIAVDAIECWLLPFYFPTEKANASKTVGCLATLNKGLQKAGHKWYIDSKEPKRYEEAVKPFKKQKELLKSYHLNESLSIFVERLKKVMLLSC
jgi:hypothetical protein